MEHIPVKSSQIASIAHDPETNTMEVIFNGGSHYRYEGVSPEVFSYVRDAESVGNAFGRHIKGNSDIKFSKVEKKKEETK
jgi:hypothetical protein